MLSGRRLPPPHTRLRRRARRAVAARCGTNFPRHLGPTARRQLRRGPLRASSGRRTSAGAKHAERARERHRTARGYRQHRHARGRDRGIAGGGAGDREAGAGGGLSGGGPRTREACALGARRGKAHAHLEVSRDHICFKQSRARIVASRMQSDAAFFVDDSVFDEQQVLFRMMAAISQKLLSSNARKSRRCSELQPQRVQLFETIRQNSGVKSDERES